MTTKNLKIFLSLIFVVSTINFSCSETDINSNKYSNSGSGVIISFDDNYVDEWFEVNYLLKDFDWKATFFVTRFQQLSESDIQKLIKLKNYGHEIAGHGLNHLDAPAFISAFGSVAYLNQEILPMKKLMKDKGLPVTSFAYPFGSRSPLSDSILLNEFKIIRGVTSGNTGNDSQICYFKNSRIVFGLGIDNYNSYFSIPYLISLLDYAKTNNKIVVFYAHKPVLTFQSEYEIEYQTLIEICRYVKNNNMKFYKISELYDL